MATKELFLPGNVFRDQDTVYYMSAKHRGDMYHMRAAMQLLGGDHSLVLYETDWVNPNKRATQDIEDYLARSTRHNQKTTFFVPWKPEKILGKKRLDATDLNNCYVNGRKLDLNPAQYRRTKVTVIGEGDTTTQIKRANKTAAVLEKIREGMFLLQPSTKTYLNEQLKNVFEDAWGVKLDKQKTTILALYRDTGQNPGGAYPEFDTGNGIDVIRSIGKVLPAGGPQIRVLSCGTKDDNQKPGIGFYWEALPKVDAVKANGDPKDEDVTKRDIEAYFIYWAFQVGQYYQMALGLRSGALDLFTLMGIPTMSIGLRNMAGEIRHEKLAGDVFKRVNVQYDVPRHVATAYIASRYADLDPMLLCPYWNQDPPGNRPTGSGANPVTNRDPDLKSQMERANRRWNPDAINRIKAVMNALRKEQLATFSAFDSYVLEVGLKVAWQKYAGGPTLVFNADTPRAFPNVITRHVARFCYRADEKPDPKKAILSRKQSDLSPLLVMEGNLGVPQKTLRLTTDLFNTFYKEPFQKDWKRIESSP